MTSVETKKVEVTDIECKFNVGDHVKTSFTKSAVVDAVRGGKKVQYLISYTEKAKRKQRIDDKIVESVWDKPERAWVDEKDLEKVK